MTPDKPDTAAISLKRISKRYGKLLAVSELDLEVSQGEVFGFLGLNGAGKTTTIRILLDLLRPSSGTANVLGMSCQAGGLEVRTRVGYLPGELGLYGDMTGYRTLEFLARLCRQTVEPEYREQLRERLELSAADLRRKVREYSTGMKRKLGLIQALQNDPPLLILDEPTEGLDPLMQEAFYQLLADLHRRGRTIFMSSHVLSEVERVCDRIAVLRAGEVVLLSEVDEVRNLAARRVRVFFSADCDLRPGELPPEHEVIESDSRLWSLRVNGPLGPLLKYLAGFPVRDMQVEEPHLEDVIMKYYRKETS
ncbi:MAG: ABC transporter ATP-binding protein [Acidobacteriota bacterium]